MRELSYKIEKADEGKSIKDFLRRNHGYSSKSLTKLKKNEDGITINGVHARTIDLLKEGDVLRLKFYEKDRPYIETNLKCEIVFEDEDLIVYNKPPFMPCHTSRGHVDDTLANVYASYMHSLGKEAVFRPLNRLDKDTSGLVVCAKNAYCAARITGGFNKIYTAISLGKLPKEEGTIDAPIVRENERELKRIVSKDGQRAVTHYKVIKKGKEASLVDFRLETGRTHQIRVHMAYIGCPLLGDLMYGAKSELIKRQALHCREISFFHPIKKENITLKAPYPPDFRVALDELF